MADGSPYIRNPGNPSSQSDPLQALAKPEGPQASVSSPSLPSVSKPQTAQQASAPKKRVYQRITPLLNQLSFLFKRMVVRLSSSKFFPSRTGEKNTAAGGTDPQNQARNGRSKSSASNNQLAAAGPQQASWRNAEKTALSGASEPLQLGHQRQNSGLPLKAVPFSVPMDLGFSSTTIAHPPEDWKETCKKFQKEFDVLQKDLTEAVPGHDPEAVAQHFEALLNKSYPGDPSVQSYLKHLKEKLPPERPATPSSQKEAQAQPLYDSAPLDAEALAGIESLKALGIEIKIPKPLPKLPLESASCLKLLKVWDFALYQLESSDSYDGLNKLPSDPSHREMMIQFTEGVKVAYQQGNLSKDFHNAAVSLNIVLQSINPLKDALLKVEQATEGWTEDQFRELTESSGDPQTLWENRTERQLETAVQTLVAQFRNLSADSDDALEPSAFNPEIASRQQLIKDGLQWVRQLQALQSIQATIKTEKENVQKVLPRLLQQHVLAKLPESEGAGAAQPSLSTPKELEQFLRKLPKPYQEYTQVLEENMRMLED